MAGTAGFAGALANGVIHVYSGPQPVNADAAPTGTLLGIITKDAGAFTPGSATNGLTFAAAANGGVTKSADVWKFVGLAAGTAGWFRHVGNAVDDGSVSATLPRLDGAIAAGAGDLRMSSVAITVGVPVTVDVYSFAIPAQ
ncbi:hypothetical protein DBR23_17650 [Acidovorax sp. HMWF018]|nr:hypothetical protein DBR23_17650 [Acidovorax sp. HMWF018]